MLETRHQTPLVLPFDRSRAVSALPALKPRRLLGGLRLFARIPSRLVEEFVIASTFQPLPQVQPGFVPRITEVEDDTIDLELESENEAAEGNPDSANESDTGYEGENDTDDENMKADAVLEGIDRVDSPASSLPTKTSSRKLDKKKRTKHIPKRCR